MTLTPARPLAPPGISVHVEPASPDRWHLGLPVLAAAQAATGLPRSVAAADLPGHLLDRQRRALQVWLASVHTPDGSTVVGHALVLPVEEDHPVWGGVADVAIAGALGRGRLGELGGLAVAPGWTGLGAARALVRARLRWLGQHGYAGCSSVWRDSPGSLHLAHRHGRHLREASSETHERFAYLA